MQKQFATTSKTKAVHFLFLGAFYIFAFAFACFACCTMFANSEHFQVAFSTLGKGGLIVAAFFLQLNDWDVPIPLPEAPGLNCNSCT